MITRPVLKYPGGKFIDGPWIVEHFPRHLSFVDVFGGGANIILRKPRSRYEYYNDTDGALVNFFTQLRDNPLKLARLIRWTPYSREVFERAKTEQCNEGLQGALNFYITIWQGHTRESGYRTRGNIGGEGRYNPAGMWSDLTPLFEAAERFRGVHIEHLSYKEICTRLDHPETLFYLDPPYLGTTRTAQKIYANELLSVDEHQELLDFVKSLSGMVLLSGYPSDLYDQTLTGWDRSTKQTLDNKRNERTEVIWMNQAAVRNRSQQELFA